MTNKHEPQEREVTPAAAPLPEASDASADILQRLGGGVAHAEGGPTAPRPSSVTRSSRVLASLGPPPSVPRDEKGRVLPGSALRQSHGVRAYQLHGVLALPEALRKEMEEFRAALVRDQGGEAELSTVRSAYVRRLGDLETILQLLAADLATRGLTTPKGAPRGTFVAFLNALDRWDKLAQRLGMERRTREIRSAIDILKDGTS